MSRICPQSPRWLCTRVSYGRVESGKWREGGVQTFGGLRVLFVQKPATVPPIEHGGEAPWALLERLHILDLYDEDVTWLCALDLERA